MLVLNNGNETAATAASEDATQLLEGRSPGLELEQIRVMFSRFSSAVTHRESPESFTLLFMSTLAGLEEKRD